MQQNQIPNATIKFIINITIFMNSKLSISICIYIPPKSEKMIDTRKSWTIQQDQSILQIVQELGTKNWPLVSQLMKEKYCLLNRSGKQCRQRWYNQLNPQLNKHPWNEDQEQRLFQAHRKFGNRWIQIAKQLKGRTDNSIKNQFYSTIRRSLRRICKILGNRNSTSKLRNIKPSILSQVFQFSKTKQIKRETNNQIIDIGSCLLQYAREKPSKKSGMKTFQRGDLEQLVNRLISLNEQYIKFKMHRKKRAVVKQQKRKEVEMRRERRKKVEQKRESANNWKETSQQSSEEEVQQTNLSIQESNMFEKFEKQHRKDDAQTHTLQSWMHFDDRVSSDQQMQHFQFQSSFFSSFIPHQSLESNYLPNPVPIHYMFDSIQNFNDKQSYFHSIKTPSFEQIPMLADSIVHNFSLIVNTNIHQSK